MIPAPHSETRIANATTKAVQRGLALIICFQALLLNFGCYYLGVSTGWGHPATLLLLLFGVVIANCYLVPAGKLCWANIFLLLLSGFHLGYYIPVRLGLVQELFFMPPVASRVGQTAMLIFCASVFAFESGVLAASIYVGGINRRERYTRDPHANRVVLQTGLIISYLSAFALIIFVHQVGGLSSLTQLSYQGIYDFAQQGDSRFLITGMWFLFPGLLLAYVGLCFSGASRRQFIWWRVSAILGFLSQVALGARGGAFLFVLGFVYLHNHLRGKVKGSALLIVATCAALLAPLVAMYRRADPGNRIHNLQISEVGPLALAVEMGGTYRVFYEFVDIFSKDKVPLFLGRSYTMTLKRMLPNLGGNKRTEDDKFLRSTQWITERTDPVAAAANIGLGSSGIAEPYANFGYLGVVGGFGLVGFFVSYFEATAVIRKKIMPYAVLAIIFIPLCWYIRDDVFGAGRLIVWPAALIAAMSFLYTAFPRTASSLSSRSLRLRARLQIADERI